jgi:hypothetical protein
MTVTGVATRSHRLVRSAGPLRSVTATVWQLALLASPARIQTRQRRARASNVDA